MTQDITVLGLQSHKRYRTDPTKTGKAQGRRRGHKNNQH
jgi:hypothetical protein